MGASLRTAGKPRLKNYHAFVVRLDWELYDRLVARAEAEETKLGETVRRALDAYLD